MLSELASNYSFNVYTVVIPGLCNFVLYNSLHLSNELEQLVIRTLLILIIVKLCGPSINIL